MTVFANKNSWLLILLEHRTWSLMYLNLLQLSVMYHLFIYHLLISPLSYVYLHIIIIVYLVLCVYVDMHACVCVMAIGQTIATGSLLLPFGSLEWLSIPLIFTLNVFAWWAILQALTIATWFTEIAAQAALSWISWICLSHPLCCPRRESGAQKMRWGRNSNSSKQGHYLLGQ